MPVTKGRRWIIAALFVSAPWPRFVDLERLPPTALATFRDEAVDTFRLAHDHPVERLWLTVMAQNLRLTEWRDDPGSCAGGSTTWPHLRDVRVTLTVIGPWGIPMGREAITCGGAGWQRDAFFRGGPGRGTAVRTWADPYRTGPATERAIPTAGSSAACHLISLAAGSQSGITCNLWRIPRGGVTVPEPCR